jgi:hypothetical protein
MSGHRRGTRACMVAILGPYRDHVTYTVYVTCRLYEDIGTPGQRTCGVKCSLRCSPSILLGTVNGQASAALF